MDLDMCCIEELVRPSFMAKNCKNVKFKEIFKQIFNTQKERIRIRTYQFLPHKPFLVNKLGWGFAGV